MRRATPLGPLSPKLLTHFAAAALVLTALLALFASGEEWGAQAQIKAVDAKNQLVATEAEKLGTKKLVSKLEVSKEAPADSFGDDDSNFGGISDGGAYRPARATRPLPQAAKPALPVLQQPGAVVSQDPVAGEAPPRGDPRKKTARPEPFQPSAEQIEQAQAASQMRGGSGASAN